MESNGNFTFGNSHTSTATSVTNSAMKSHPNETTNASPISDLWGDSARKDLNENIMDCEESIKNEVQVA